MATNAKEFFEGISEQFRDLNGLHPGLWPIAPSRYGFCLTVVVLVLGWFLLGWTNRGNKPKAAGRSQVEAGLPRQNAASD
jgi:type IV pilus assembly protein PilO